MLKTQLHSYAATQRHKQNALVGKNSIYYIPYIIFINIIYGINIISFLNPHTSKKPYDAV